jgi:hypothetical protein
MNKKSELKECMRMAYEEFCNILYQRLNKDNPRDKKIVDKVEKSVNKLLDEEFGKDSGGFVD